jgi:hypothetical protein
MPTTSLPNILGVYVVMNYCFCFSQPLVIGNVFTPSSRLITCAAICLTKNAVPTCEQDITEAARLCLGRRRYSPLIDAVYRGITPSRYGPVHVYSRRQGRLLVKHNGSLRV